ncbi:MAG: lysine--tRNA ligase [Candidatus Odinarchaeum yellowstonii]|uniref:Lysine--tRNA ligase n=1 Tax=Odinarchaeota yellowstonii (strain LCB_4) TaxID=1841599 RepID=A0AAF0D2R7_ODILC|nr:MAG: lysine--tRNA ligase [Candidatus Odinarchaeum yellowstonii]
MSEMRVWIEEIADEILKRKTDKIVINSGKSISGRIHIGIFRELFICDSLKRILDKKGFDAEFYFILDDYDPAKKFPSYIPSDYDKYIGAPFSDIPSPFSEGESYAEFFAKELISTFSSFGLNPKILWTSKLYNTVEMKNIIRTVINKVDEIRSILISYVGETLNEEDAEEYRREVAERYPISVVCKRCGKMQVIDKGKIKPNRVLNYIKETDEVIYYCHSCKKEFKEKLEDARLKLTWRVDWPAKWFLLKVTCEPAGKDHTVKGGAYDTGLRICQEVFGYEGPVKIGYEWLRYGDVDMKTHKGIIFTPREYLEIGQPEVLRYLIIRTPPSKHISFRPELLPQYIDEYERFERVFFNNQLDASDEEKYEASILYPLTLVDEKIQTIKPKLPFRFAVIFSQLKEIMNPQAIMVKAQEVVKKIYKIPVITDRELKEIEETIRKAANWVLKYGSENYKIHISKSISGDIKESLTEAQKTVIRKVAELLSQGDFTEEELQNKIFNIIKEVEGLDVKKGFESIYMVILGKKYGPRLGSFLLSLDRDWLIERLNTVLK